MPPVVCFRSGRRNCLARRFLRSARIRMQGSLIQISCWFFKRLALASWSVEGLGRERQNYRYLISPSSFENMM